MICWSRSPGHGHQVKVSRSWSPDHGHQVMVSRSGSPGQGHQVMVTRSLSPGHGNQAIISRSSANHQFIYRETVALGRFQQHRVRHCFRKSVIVLVVVLLQMCGYFLLFGRAPNQITFFVLAVYIVVKKRRRSRRRCRRRCKERGSSSGCVETVFLFFFPLKFCC